MHHKTMTRIILVGISVFLYAATAHADAIGRLKSFIASTRSGQANFTQELLDRKGKRIQFVSGTMQFVRPGKFRWSYQKPYEQLIVGNGEKFWLYDVDLNQVTEKKLDAALGSSPAALLSGNNDIERGFALRDISCDAAHGTAAQTQPASAAADDHAACLGGHENDGLEWLEAIPRNQEASIEKIRMAFNQKSDLVVVELYDTFGHNTVLHFSNLQRNPKLSPKLFQFEPPPDADILRDE
jgi:outer membrane lipoprotein carrier protein